MPSSSLPRDNLTRPTDRTVRPEPAGLGLARPVIYETGPELDSETRDLLQSRLRAASLVLALGFGIFLLRDIIFSRLVKELIYLHGLILMLLILNVSALSSRWKPSMGSLRILEVATFGMIVAYFLVGQYLGLSKQTRIDGDPWELAAAVKNGMVGMLSLIFIYGIYIPNDWKRAGRVIIPMAMTPVVVLLGLSLTVPRFRALLEEDNALGITNLIEHSLYMLLGTIAAIYGTYTINRFRTEAFNARRLNQYRLGEKLGQGGMGEVYMAEHQLFKRPCAIKLIRPGLSHKPSALARFEREVRATAKLSAWNTIEVYDYGRAEDGTFYYVMEYLPGASLQDLVEKHGPLPAGRVIYLMRQACDALREAHGVGLIHRDLKPPNIFAAYRGGRYDVAKLLDFGLVKSVREEESPSLTREGMVTGSPLYMAPEQVMRTHAPDERTDIYSLGAVAYFLITGRPPFEGDDAMAVMVAHARDQVAPPSRFSPDVPADLERIVLRCLEKEPDLRFQAAQSLGQALASCADAATWSDEQAAAWWQANQPLENLQDQSDSSLPGDLLRNTVETGVDRTLEASDLNAINPSLSSDRIDLSMTIGEDQTLGEG